MKITALTNGPLLVEVSSQICDQNGRPYALQSAAKVALCRCGASSDKPFCDGTHAKIGFIAAAQPSPVPSGSPPEPNAAPPTIAASVATWENEGGKTNGVGPKDVLKPKVST
jgi:CDGSH-type Zn-finger protein